MKLAKMQIKRINKAMEEIAKRAKAGESIWDAFEDVCYKSRITADMRYTLRDRVEDYV